MQNHPSDNHVSFSSELFLYERIYAKKLPQLTKTECKFCAALRIHGTLKAVALTLNIATATAETHCKHVKHKLGITGKGHLYKHLVILGEE